MRWRDAITDPPKEPRDYFVWHPRWGRVVCCWRNGWGWDGEKEIAKPESWLDETE